MNGVVEHEADLVRQAQQGDRAAFEQLYDQYFERIYDFSYQMVRNPDDAADVVSEAFLKAVERLHGLRDPDAFRGWLYAIARNCALNLIQRRRRTRPMPEDLEPVAFTPGAALDPQASAESGELAVLVWEAAATLNPRDYSIFEMTVRQGLEPGEVAEALGVKPSHAYVLLSRLRDTVEDALGAVVMARAGRRDCDELDTVVSRFGDERTPKMRKAVTRHMKGCAACRDNRKKYASAAALLGGIAAAAPAVGLKDELAADLVSHWEKAGPETASRRKRRRRLRASSMVAVLIVASLLAFDHPSYPTPAMQTPTPPPTPAVQAPVATALPAATAEPTPEPRPAATVVPRLTPRPTPRTPTQIPQAPPTPAPTLQPTPSPTPVVIVVTPAPTTPSPTPVDCQRDPNHPDCQRTGTTGAGPQAGPETR